MSLVPLDNLVKSSYVNEYDKLEWIPYSKVTDIRSSPIDNVCYASYDSEIILVLLGSNEECTPALVSEFARIYSLPTHKYNKVDNNFKRYSKWLSRRNRLIKGFTKYEDKFYMVADKLFYHCYSRYGFCTACGTLRSSPVWCISKYPMDGLATISNSMSLLRNLNYKQTQQMIPIWNGFHWIVLVIIMDTCMVYLLIMLN